MTTGAFPLRIPVILEVPDRMAEPVRKVLGGEYDAGYSGTGLTVLDIGANVGSFAVWAHHRWPGSTIQCYEPQPDTFAILERNIARWPNISARRVAVAAGGESALFWTRYPGDGESGLARAMGTTFADLDSDTLVEVPVLDPAHLPAADIVKIDVEGVEAEIVERLDLSAVGLLLVEFQNDGSRQAIREAVGPAFDLVHEDAFAWSDLLEDARYNRALAGDHWGHLFFARREGSALTRDPDPAVTFDPPPPAGLRQRLGRRLRRGLGRGG